MTNQAKSYVRIVVLERCLGLSQRNLNQRGVQFKLIDGIRQYDFETVVARCGDLIYNNLSRAENSGVDSNDIAGPETSLRDQEMAERVRKLKLDNDVKEGILTHVDEVKLAAGRKFREVADILDTIPTAVKMGCPDIPQSALEVVKRSVDEIKNKVAAHKVSRPDDA